MINRKPTNTVKIGNIAVGGGNPIAVQTMCNTVTEDVAATVAQIKAAAAAGCHIIRVAVPNEEAAKAIYDIKSQIDIPLVADIHFSHKLAILAVEAGADKIRINPGNIGSSDRVKEVVDTCKSKGIPIRIGVNSGSLEKDVLAKHGAPTAEALAESMMRNVALLESFDFNDLVLSVKSSSVVTTIESYRILSQNTPYPLHVGVTEAGTEKAGIAKSALGIGSLLLEGIGDTFRVSLTADPLKEITCAYDILSAVGYETGRPEIVSCPTCGRTQIDLIGLANKVESALATVNKPIKVAVMGCVVNGPGEAKEADVGVAGGKGEGVIFKKGEIIKKVPEDGILPELLAEIEKL